MSQCREPQMIVVGSEVTFDHIVVLPSLPGIGQTIHHPNLASEFRESYFGGCSANIAATVARLGIRVALSCFTGNDFERSGYQRHLDSIGVCSDWIVRCTRRPSAHCFMLYDSIGQCIALMDAIEQSDAPSHQVPPNVLRGVSRLVVVGGDIDDPSTPSCLSLAGRAKAEGIPIGLSMTGGSADIDPNLLQMSDLVICNHREAERLAAKHGLDGLDHLGGLGPKLFFITHGQQGSDLLMAGKTTRIPSVNSDNVVDPTGAGDAYAGAALGCLLVGYPPLISARLGSVVASFVVERKGCQTNMPDWSTAVARYEASFGRFPEGFADDAQQADMKVAD